MCLNHLYSLQSSWAQGYGCVLDSGTTFTYLPSDAFRALLTMLEQLTAEKGLSRKPGPDPQVRREKLYTHGFDIRQDSQAACGKFDAKEVSTS